MAEMTWQDAIREVLSSSTTPLHYREITEQILEKGLKRKVGATPRATVNAQITASIKKDGEASPYRRVARGTYVLSDSPAPSPPAPFDEGNDDEDEVVISFGSYWERDKVDWKSKPRLFGVFQTEGASRTNPEHVDFSAQHGVYLLHDVREVIYVGRTTEGDLGTRLWQHTRDRLQGRWSRFSWFGFRSVSDEGKLTDRARTLPSTYDPTHLIAMLEAVLIEALEPRQKPTTGGWSGGGIPPD